MTREDVLRELELLPVWQLRTSDLSVKITAEIQTQPIVNNHITLSTLTFNLIASEDEHWLFVLPQNIQQDEDLLLRNIFKAIAIKPKKTLQEASIEQLGEYKAKLMIVMDEVIAQKLLNTAERLEILRGTVHRYQETPLITTFSLSHLLLNAADKSKAWEDLCLAISTLEGLSLSH